MIPPDLASRLRFVSQDLPAAPQPVASARQLSDVLSELSAGQKIFADIQALLPNGTYRAIVSQRELTLALPFSAKAGDTIELEVQETDGKLNLAFVANRSSTPQETESKESVSTTLSKAGNLIGDLLSEIDRSGGKPKPVLLNESQPLVSTFPEDPQELVPILKDTLSKSGMFYESHQAKWVAGSVSTNSLLQEPQGKQPPLFPMPPPAVAPPSLDALSQDTTNTSTQPHLAQDTTPATQLKSLNDNQTEITQVVLKHDSTEDTPAVRHAITQPQNTDFSTSSRPNTPINAELTPIVQQQLNALATQNYVWQGQIWPGQNMHWEITQEDHQTRTENDKSDARWQTRLSLNLPKLGDVDVTLRLSAGGNLELSLATENTASQQAFRLGEKNLSETLKSAGIKLNSFAIRQDDNSDR
jgi:hypothetical protein